MQSKNPILKAVYYHVLWKGLIRGKNEEYAINAVDSYFQVVIYYLRKANGNNEKKNYHLVRKLENIISLSVQTKLRIEELKQLIKTLLASKTLEFYLKHSILHDILKYPKIFKPEYFENTLKIFEEKLAAFSDKGEDFFNLKHLELY